MYISSNDLRGFTLVGGEEEIGHAKDIYIDDDDWIVSYLVVETGGWFSSNKILIDTSRIRAFDFDRNRLMTSMTKAEVENAPSASSRETVSEANEKAWLLEPSNHVYLAGTRSAVLPFSLYGGMPGSRIASAEAVAEEAERETTRHLRSGNEITGYSISASDGRIGSVSDLIIDPSDWKLAFLSVDTGSWLPGKLVILPPKLAEAVSWSDRSIAFAMTTQQIEESPPLSGLDDLERGHEELLYAHYGFPPMM